ncbi:unnamed protein product [Prorocentrum cordatum]|uniref:Uncharacterized protein n=1 Tax=Prorocentrum cordatum TaxID=2364126 RepID=A0ABN9SW36_9DINO|nr:unnamed protein product [Polarella glacialis]
MLGPDRPRPPCLVSRPQAAPKSGRGSGPAGQAEASTDGWLGATTSSFRSTISWPHKSQPCSLDASTSGFFPTTSHPSVLPIVTPRGSSSPGRSPALSRTVPCAPAVADVQTFSRSRKCRLKAREHAFTLCKERSPADVPEAPASLPRATAAGALSRAGRGVGGVARKPAYKDWLRSAQLAHGRALRSGGGASGGAADTA